MKRYFSRLLLTGSAIFLVAVAVFSFKVPETKAVIDQVMIAGQLINLIAGGQDPIGQECPQDGYSYTKPSPGIGPMPCGTNQCRPEGYLYFTACLSQSDCNQIGGTTDLNNKAGCTPQGGVELYCCRKLKNGCNVTSKDPNKLYLCTTDDQCSKAGGDVFGKGLGCSGEYSTCCEFADSATAPMKKVGKPLLSGTSQDTSGGGGGSTGGGASSGRVQRSYEYIDNFCHTAIECGEAGGTFESGFGCPYKGDQPQGYCLSPEAEYELQRPLFGVSKITGLRQFIAVLFNGAIGVLIIASAVFFIWGAFKYLVSAVVTSIQRSKEIMIDSLVGLALGLGAFAILSNINPNLLNLTKQKIYMINRVVYYDVVYCSDLIDQSKMLMDAGTREEPLSYTAQLSSVGFKTPIDQAKCGREYFIDGADTLSVCLGNSCPSGACLNCASSKSPGCKTSSAYEYACLDAHFAGNVIMKGHWSKIEVSLNAICKWKEGGQEKMESYTIASESLKNILGKDETNDVSAGGSSGKVGAFAIKLDSGDVKKLQFFEAECTKTHAGGEARVLAYLNLTKSGDALVSCVGCSESGLEVNIVSKEQCNKVVRPPAPPSFSTLSIEGNDALYQYQESRFQNAWTVSEIVNTVESNRAITCSMTANDSVLSKVVDAAKKISN